MPTRMDVEYAVSVEFNTTIRRLRARSRKQPVCFARQMAITIERELLGAKFKELAAWWHCCHATAEHARNTFFARMHTEQETRERFNRIAERLRR
jgi:chromosomal replication initiation ATPase DnaA